MKITKKLEQIKDITFFNPELYKDNAKEIIVNKYKELQLVSNQLQESRQKVRELEAQWKNINDSFVNMTRSAHIEYETIEVEVADAVQHNIRIINDEDARNQ